MPSSILDIIVIITYRELLPFVTMYVVHGVPRKQQLTDLQIT